jgi:hypothetical protein
MALSNERREWQPFSLVSSGDGNNQAHICSDKAVSNLLVPFSRFGSQSYLLFLGKEGLIRSLLKIATKLFVFAHRRLPHFVAQGAEIA